MVVITRCDLDRLQSVINAVARLMVGEHCAALRPHLTSSRRPSLAADGRTYKLCVLVYRCLHAPAPCYLQQTVLSGGEHGITASSAVSHMVPIAATRRSTLGDRAFAVAGPRVWNNLPDAIRLSPSLETFKRSLKSHFFFFRVFCLVLVSYS